MEIPWLFRNINNLQSHVFVRLQFTGDFFQGIPCPPRFDEPWHVKKTNKFVKQGARFAPLIAELIHDPFLDISRK